MSSTLPQPNSCCTLCNGQTVTIIDNGGGAGGGSSSFLVAETLAALRDFPSNASNQIAILLGNLIKYDNGPAKTYYWDAASVDPDNPFNVVVPNDAPAQGRWIEVV